MKEYLEQTKFATQKIIEIITHDTQKLEEVRGHMVKLPASIHTLQIVFEMNEMSPNANHHHAHLMSAEEEKGEIERDLRSKMIKLQEEMSTKKISLSALSGALLQIAKQGISIKYGNNAPDGDDCNGIPVKSFIWEGRNQSLHYEEKKPRPPITELFQNISANFKGCEDWNPADGANYAHKIINLLGWNKYSQYEKHMLSFDDEK